MVYLYLFIAVVVMLIGVYLWVDEHKECDRIGARTFFLAPVWPLVVVYFITKQFGSMWKATGWSKKTYGNNRN
jgi:hypothetical protein